MKYSGNAIIGAANVFIFEALAAFFAYGLWKLL